MKYPNRGHLVAWEEAKKNCNMENDLRGMLYYLSLAVYKKYNFQKIQIVMKPKETWILEIKQVGNRTKRTKTLRETES